MHRLEELVPFVPVEHSIGDIEDEHVDTGITEHREVATYHPLVLREKIARLGFSPVVGPCCPLLIAAVQAGLRVGIEHLCHVGLIGFSVVQVHGVPCDIEDAYSSILIRLL